MRPLKTIFAALVLAIGMSSAYADEEGDDDGDTGEPHVADHADPEAGTLPSHASDTARANAFGQQGERMRAAQQAAREAAVDEARRAAHEIVAGRPESPGRSAGKAKGPATQSEAGLARAAEAAAAGRARADAARTQHPPRGPR